MSEWEECYLSDVGTLARGKSKHRPRWAEHLYGGSYPFIQTGEISAANKYINTYRQSYSEAGLAQSKLWDKGTLCITIAANIAEIAILDVSACFPDSILGFVPDPEKADLDFVFYTLTFFKEKIQNLAIGSVQENINLGTFQNIKFLFPTIEEQKQVSAVLSCLDRKIENLRRQNETLEKIAQTLFKHWFVDFEFPFDFAQGKPFDFAQGEPFDPSTGSGQCFAQGKPYKSSGGAMQPSELGDIPIGWRVGTFDDFFELFSGGTPKTNIAEYWDGDVKWLSGKDVTSHHKNFIIETEKTISSLGLDNSAAKLLPQYTMVISARGTVGNYCILSDEMAISQSNFGVLAKQEEYIFFGHLLIASLIDRLKGEAYGSVFDTITTSNFRRLSILTPHINVIGDFEKIVSRIFRKILVNSKQIQTLTKTRDVLLPQLMSGKLRITPP